MNNAIISQYENIKQVTGGKEVALDLLLDNIREGKWQDLVLTYRTIKTAPEQKAYKEKHIPYVTISGTFGHRSDKGLIKHSEYICVDIDDVDPNEIKQILTPDRHVFACFTSISGQGVAAIFKINPSKHYEAFRGLEEYLFKNYKIIIDSLPDVSRPRFISFDPHLFTNDNAAKFAQYSKEKEAPTKVEKIVFAKSDFEAIVQEIQQRNLNICDDYHTWLRLGFAISDKFGEAGRIYYHAISAPSGKYNADDCDKQYTKCLKAGRTGVTISTLYYHAKQAGVQTYSNQTKLIAQAATHAKKGGRTAEQAIENIEKFEGIAPEQSSDIVKQIFDNNIDFADEDSILHELEQYLRHNYTFRRNVLTRYIENEGKVLHLADFNSIYIKAKKIFDKLSYDLLERLINSDFVPNYNPLIDFIDLNEHKKPKGVISKLWATIQTDKPDFVNYFGTKWIVGVIASIYGEHSPLMMVLSGVVQNTGKTEFWRRLLPDGISRYYGESKLDAGKDDDILMTQKLLIMDDEMGGKSKKDEKRLKELLSKQFFSLREPYGRNNVDLLRLAVLCGTSNENKLLNDPTGNRRIIPAQVNAINQDDYNSIDKTEVFMEAYHLYKSGWQWRLTKDDIELLNNNTEKFENYSSEYELITKFFKKPTNAYPDLLTASEIKVYIEKHTNQRLAVNKIGQELIRLGFEQKSQRLNGSPRWVYVVEMTQVVTPQTNFNNDTPSVFTTGNAFTPPPGTSDDSPF